jgi:sugar transferase (PEP-CTERM system associated)
MKVFERSVPRLRIVLFLFEFALLLGIFYATSYLHFLLRNGWDTGWLFDEKGCFSRCLLVVVVCQMCMYLNELYGYEVIQKNRELAIRLLKSLGIACIFLSGFYVTVASLCVGQAVFLVSMPTAIFAIFFWRMLYQRLTRSDALKRRVAILGSSGIALQIMEKVQELRDSDYEIVALFQEPGDTETFPPDLLDERQVFPVEEFPSRIESMAVDCIVVAMNDRRGRLPFATLVNCRFQGIYVVEASSFYEELYGKILLDGLRPSYFIFSDGFRKNAFTRNLKRVCDLVLAILLLILACPLMLVTALAIKLDSRGTIIYRQDRVGANWKDYTLYKFRSMVENAEAQGVKWAEQDDPRVTRVGRIIRRYRIDELPQLFNVITGAMSFVGPRPERRYFVVSLAKEIPFYPQRLFVKPGVTGWAQIKYHYGASKNDTREKLQYDLYYIKHMSLLFDLSIIFDTIRVVLSGKGAR